LATSPATSASSPSNLVGTVARNVDWLAIAKAVAGGPYSDMLRKALLVFLHHVVEGTIVCHIMRTCLMNRTPYPQGRCCRGSHRDVGPDLFCRRS
jgi:hypothetical protein